MAVRYPSRISLAQRQTPLQPLERLSRELGGPRLWVKRDDLTECALSGNKVRKLEFSIAQALAEGCDTLITCGGLQSNHCRATALAAARLGLKAHLILRGTKPDGALQGNLFLDQLSGAEITFLGAPEYARRDEVFRNLTEHYAAKGHKAFSIPTGASDEIGLWGYIAAAEELKADCERAGFRPTHVLSATGSGGTQAGLTAGNALVELGARVWGVNVCDDAATFIAKIRGDLRAWRARYQQDLDVDALEVNVLDGHVGAGYAIPTPEGMEAIRHLARTEGLVLDPVYTGKAFAGLLAEIRAGRFRAGEDVVFVLTGGIFGLLAQTNEFAPHSHHR